LHTRSPRFLCQHKPFDISETGFPKGTSNAAAKEGNLKLYEDRTNATVHSPAEGLRDGGGTVVSFYPSLFKK